MGIWVWSDPDPRPGPKRNEEFNRPFKNYLNGYHFVDIGELVLNILFFFQTDIPYGKSRDFQIFTMYSSEITLGKRNP